MLQIDLITIFNGLIKNYINLDLDKNSTKEEIIEKEIKYFITLGRVLGVDVTYRNLVELEKVPIVNWFLDEKDRIVDLEISKEDDLLNDLSSIHKLISDAKDNRYRSYIKIIETSSINRINYLNNIIINNNIENNMLIVYVIKDVLNNKSYYNAYLFKDKLIVKEKKAMIKLTKNYKLKGLI